MGIVGLREWLGEESGGCEYYSVALGGHHQVTVYVLAEKAVDAV